jgi:RNase P subunit RPR2
MMAELVVWAADWPHGLRCGECRLLLEPGDRYAERLTGMAGEIPVVEIVCRGCEDQVEP